MAKGCIQVYTGNGKGKTTAAVGLCMRSLAAGRRVYFCQFMKQGYTGERKAFESFGDLAKFVQYGRGCELRNPDAELDAKAAQEGLACALEAMTSGEYDVVVLDEANVADSMGHFLPGALRSFIEAKPEGVELVITGRGASEETMRAADLVTEMKEVKHYYSAGVPARRGIEF